MPSATLSKKSPLPTASGSARLLKAAEISVCQRSYAAFLKCAWREIEGDTDLVWNWHLDYLCDEYQAAIERVGAREPKLLDIVTNIPPRSLKSSVATIFLNAWAWTRWPWMKFITASYSAELANQHALKTRAVIQSDWYRSNWPSVIMRKDQDRVSEFTNTRGGFRKAVGVGGSVTGLGGDVLLVDDPINPLQAFSEAHIQRAKDWFSLSFQNRLNDHHIGIRMIIMQRLHEDDLSGFVIERDPDRWKHIQIPGEDSYKIKPPELEKFYVKGLFFPERFTRADLNQFKIDYGEIGYANQIGQSPSPLEGTIFKAKHFKRYRPGDIPSECDRETMSCDLTFKKTGTSKVCVQIWKTDGVRHYVVPVINEKLSYVETKDAILRTINDFPRAYAKLIEDKANGSALLSDFELTVPGLIAVEKSKSKIENASLASVAYQAGNIFVPEGPDGDSFIQQHLMFPRAKFNDQVDCATQYIIHQMQGRSDAFEAVRRDDEGLRNKEF